MKCIKDEFSHEIEIKKSRFICHLKRCQTKDEAEEFIKKIKYEHKNATHNCSCYKIGIISKANDDGEPSGTAAIPMLEVINKNKFDQICVVVTRYFGGIKLGAGGLIRAYSKSVSSSIDICEYINLVDGYKYDVIFSYPDVKHVDYVLEQNKVIIRNKKFEMNICYTLESNIEKFDIIKECLNEVNHLIRIENKKNIYVIGSNDE